MGRKKTSLRLWAVAFWLMVWQLAAMALRAAYPHGELLLASPVNVLLRLGQLAVTAAFWRTVAWSGIRIFGGFLISTVLAVVLAALAAARPRGEQLFTGSLLGLKYFFASFGARIADTRTLRGLACPEDLLSRPDLCADLERWGRDWAVRLAEGRP